MNGQPLTIALAGSAGTGKTTLGRSLAQALGLPFLEEGMRRRLEAGLDWALLHREPMGYERLLADLWREQREHAAAAVEQFGGYVADRSPYDHAAFWLHYGSLHDRARTEAWMAELLEAGSRLSHVLLLPWGEFALENDGVRSTDRWLQFRFQAILEGLLERFAPTGQVLPSPPELDLAARVQHFLCALDRRPAP